AENFWNTRASLQFTWRRVQTHDRAPLGSAKWRCFASRPVTCCGGLELRRNAEIALANSCEPVYGCNGVVVCVGIISRQVLAAFFRNDRGFIVCSGNRSTRVHRALT